MMVYILIGVALMFLLEHFTSLKTFKKYVKTNPKAYIGFGFWERTFGILLWPLWLLIFLYNFFKEFFK